MSGTVYISIMEIKQLSKKHGCKASSGKPLNWIVSSENDRTEYSVRKIATKTRKTAKKAITFFNISKFS